jgi:hypothetical protein
MPPMQRTNPIEISRIRPVVSNNGPPNNKSRMPTIIMNKPTAMNKKPFSHSHVFVAGA